MGIGPGPNADPSLYPKLFDFGKALDDVPQLLQAARAQKERERMDRAKEARDQAVHQDNLARLKIQDQRAASVFQTQEQTRKRQEAQDRVAAYGQMNEALNPRSPKYNPESANTIGEAWGLGKPQLQTPQQPQAPQPPPELEGNLGVLTRTPYEGSQTGGAPVEHDNPEEVGRDDLIARALEEGRGRIKQGAMDDPNWQGGPGRQYAQQLQDYEAAQQAYPGQVAQAKENPVYTATDEQGRPVRFAPTENESALNRIAQEDAARMRAVAAATSDPALKAMFTRAADLVEQRQVKPGAAIGQVNTERADETKRIGSPNYQRTDERQQQEMDLAGVKASAAEAAARGRSDIQLGNQQMRMQGLHDQELTQFKASEDYKHIKTNEMEISRMQADLTAAMKAGDGAGASKALHDVLAQAQLIHSMSGAAVTEQEFNRYDTAFGLAQNSANRMQKLLEGGYTPEKEKALADLFVTMRKANKMALDGLGLRWQHTVQHSATPELQALSPQAVGEITGEYGNEPPGVITAPQVHRPVKSHAPPVKAAAAAKNADDLIHLFGEVK